MHSSVKIHVLSFLLNLIVFVNFSLLFCERAKSGASFSPTVDTRPLPYLPSWSLLQRSTTVGGELAQSHRLFPGSRIGLWELFLTLCCHLPFLLWRLRSYKKTEEHFMERVRICFIPYFSNNTYLEKKKKAIFILTAEPGLSLSHPGPFDHLLSLFTEAHMSLGTQMVVTSESPCWDKYRAGVFQAQLLVVCRFL